METGNNEQNELHISQLHNWLKTPQQDTFIREHVILPTSHPGDMWWQAESCFFLLDLSTFYKLELTFFGGSGGSFWVHRTLPSLALTVRIVLRSLETPHRPLRVSLFLGNAAIEAVHERQTIPPLPLIALFYFRYFVIL